MRRHSLVEMVTSHIKWFPGFIFISFIFASHKWGGKIFFPIRNCHWYIGKNVIFVCTHPGWISYYVSTRLFIISFQSLKPSASDRNANTLAGGLAFDIVISVKSVCVFAIQISDSCFLISLAGVKIRDCGWQRIWITTVSFANHCESYNVWSGSIDQPYATRRTAAISHAVFLGFSSQGVLLLESCIRAGADIVPVKSTVSFLNRNV